MKQYVIFPFIIGEYISYLLIIPILLQCNLTSSITKITFIREAGYTLSLSAHIAYYYICV